MKKSSGKTSKNTKKELFRLEPYARYLIEQYKASGDKNDTPTNKKEWSEYNKVGDEIDKIIEKYLDSLAIQNTKHPDFPNQLADQELFINWYHVLEYSEGSLFGYREVNGKTLSYTSSVYADYTEFISDLEQKGVKVNPVSREFVTEFIKCQEYYYWKIIVPLCASFWKF